LTEAQDIWFRRHWRALLLGSWATVQCLAVWFYVSFFLEEGYLPAPFIYDKADTFMDLFHTLSWAADPGRYTHWLSVYPPLNFLGLNLVSFVSGSSPGSDGFGLRADGDAIIVFLIVCYFVLPVLMLRAGCWSLFSRTEKTLVYVVTVTAAPLMFALERGNLVIFALPLISWLVLSRGAMQALAFACLVNLKPYFVLVGTAVLGEPRTALLCAVLTSLMFVATGLVLDENFIRLVPNLFSFSQADDLFSLREVMAFPTSIGAFAAVLRGFDVDRPFMGLALTHGDVASLLDLARYALVAISAVSLVVIPAKIPAIKLAIAIVLISNFGISAGGYSLSFLIPILPLLFGLKARAIYIPIVVASLCPLDLVSVLSDEIGKMDVFVSGQMLDIVWTLGLGSVLRPIINFIFLGSLVSELALTSPGFRLNGVVSGISHAHA
jgi:hypothetical protein